MSWLEILAQVATILGTVFAFLSYRISKRQTRRVGNGSRAEPALPPSVKQKSFEANKNKEKPTRPVAENNIGGFLASASVGLFLTPVHTYFVLLMIRELGFNAKHSGLHIWPLVNIPSQYWAEAMMDMVVIIIGMLAAMKLAKVFHQKSISMNIAIAACIPLIFTRHLIGPGYVEIFERLF